MNENNETPAVGEVLVPEWYTKIMEHALYPDTADDREAIELNAGIGLTENQSLRALVGELADGLADCLKSLKYEGYSMKQPRMKTYKALIAKAAKAKEAGL